MTALPGGDSAAVSSSISLARLWRQQGNNHEAYELLAPVYGWFTQGFDAADPQEASPSKTGNQASRSAMHGGLIAPEAGG